MTKSKRGTTPFWLHYKIHRSGVAIFLLVFFACSLSMIGLGVTNLMPAIYPQMTRLDGPDVVAIRATESWHAIGITRYQAADSDEVAAWYENAGWTGFNGGSGWRKTVRYPWPVVLEHQVAIIERIDGTSVVITTSSIVVHFP